jgi:predicted metal-binding transcription factor (methanogenesis marker protein 9)
MAEDEKKREIKEILADIRNKLTYPKTILEYLLKKELTKKQIQDASKDLNKAIRLLHKLEKK